MRETPESGLSGVGSKAHYPNISHILLSLLVLQTVLNTPPPPLSPHLFLLCISFFPLDPFRSHAPGIHAVLRHSGSLRINETQVLQERLTERKAICVWRPELVETFFEKEEEEEEEQKKKGTQVGRNWMREKEKFILVL